MKMFNISLLTFLFTSLPFLTAVTVANDPNLYDVIVVGGGISGLSTMFNLAKSGKVNTLLIEGANRLGGRVYTIPFGSNSHIELGAQV